MKNPPPPKIRLMHFLLKFYKMIWCLILKFDIQVLITNNTILKIDQDNGMVREATK